MRILIVDDNPATRLLLRDAFEEGGHEVVEEAETLDATVKAYAAHKPDVVTLDLSLAEGDGLTVMKSIRQLDDKANILVISGNVQAKVRDQIRDVGARFIAKPFSLPELLAVVSRVPLR